MSNRDPQPKVSRRKSPRPEVDPERQKRIDEMRKKAAKGRPLFDEDEKEKAS